MKISIITPTFNSAETIRDTLNSMCEQNLGGNHELEYIIMDGGSTDATRDIIASYQDKLPIIFVSEQDKGLYDAMNKGISRATGDIVGIINSDDFYASPTALQGVIEAFEASPDTDAVYGDLTYVDRHDIYKHTRFWRAGEYAESKLNGGWIIPHPTFFMRRSVYQKLNKIFDLSFRIAADYELLLRLLKVQKISVKYIPKTLVVMRDGGTSGSSIKQRIRGFKELVRAWKSNSLTVPSFFLIRRVVSKLNQFFISR